MTLRRAVRPGGGREAARSGGVRGRRHQPAAQPAPGAGGQAAGPALRGGAEHGRSGAQARPDGRRAALSRGTRRAGGADRGVKAGGDGALRALLDDPAALAQRRQGADQPSAPRTTSAPNAAEGDHDAVRRILQRLGLDELVPHTPSDRIDRVVLHPVVGPAAAGDACCSSSFRRCSPGPRRRWAGSRPAPLGRRERRRAAARKAGCRSLLVDGVIAGAGGVLVFLPQIVILFFFILVLEESRLPAARGLPARPPDGRRGAVGALVHSAAVELCLRHPRHHGRAHHRQSARPPGHDHDRAADDLLGAAAGLCAADRRLHSAAQGRGACSSLQGLVLFGLYLAGIVGALAVAWVLKRFTAPGARCAR